MPSADVGGVAADCRGRQSAACGTLDGSSSCSRCSPTRVTRRRAGCFYACGARNTVTPPEAKQAAGRRAKPASRSQVHAMRCLWQAQSRSLPPSPSTAPPHRARPTRRRHRIRANPTRPTPPHPTRSLIAQPHPLPYREAHEDRSNATVPAPPAPPPLPPQPRAPLVGSRVLAQ